jgi:flavin reductase (DIM6/NTAB) family NADH-FMN oxidoreductase RutF
MDPATPSPTTQPLPLRSALGRFTTGVTIITCVGADGSRAGITANSFNALSLEPPLVLWSLRRTSAAIAAFRAAPHFVVNVLAESQVELSRRFASAALDKFADGAWSAGLGGAPVLSGCAAVFECEQFAQHDGGDHVLFIGRVLQASESNLPPLVYQSGHYRLLGEII